MECAKYLTTTFRALPPEARREPTLGTSVHSWLETTRHEAVEPGNKEYFSEVEVVEIFETGRDCREEEEKIEWVEIG